MTTVTRASEFIWNAAPVFFLGPTSLLQIVFHSLEIIPFTPEGESAPQSEPVDNFCPVITRHCWDTLGQFHLLQ